MDTSKQNFILIGFLIIAVATGWISFKQSRVVDAIGDVAALKAKISDKQLDLDILKKEDGDSDDIKELEEDIKELREDLPAQRQDVVDAKAGLPNGAVLWIVFLQIGAAAFGVGLIKLLQNKEENDRLRSSALLILGALVIFLLIGRISYLVSSGSMSL